MTNYFFDALYALYANYKKNIKLNNLQESIV